jgi:2-polyprenyl-6-methoxyphenol hydroxylase-like FAD-dependent oxidoreductase
MAKVVVLGGGVIGLCTGMMLAGQGCAVTVIERDPEAVPGSPEDAWQGWERPGVAQFRQAHYLHPAGSRILATRLPQVWDALRGARAARFDVLSLMPPFIADRDPRDGDDRFTTLTARRPVIEYAVASVARDMLDIRPGAAVAGLLTGPAAIPGIPHVTGIRLADGTAISADLVLDALGRRSPLPGWLAALGARPPAEQAEDSGFIYYTRFFRPAGNAAPPPFLTGLVAEFDCFSLISLPGDAGTWSLTLYAATRDQALKELRHPDRWAALIRACPLHAHLLDGVPITDVMAMGGIADRIRHYVLDGTPTATGLLSVGDAWACTNPSMGRGITLGLMHAAGTADVIRGHLGDPRALALAHDEMTQATVTPWYYDTVRTDRARRAELDAAAAGRPAARAGPPDPAAPAGPPDPAARLRRAFPRAMLYDADLFRAFVETVAMLATPADVLSRPGLADKIMAVAADHEEFAMPGPSRADVLSLVG